VARQIVFIEREVVPAPATVWKAVLWVTVPVARQAFYAKPPTWKSAFSGATVQELADLRAGVIAEKVQRLSSPNGQTFNQAKADFELDWQQFQNYVNNYNPWNRYGTSWDGTGWTDTNNG